MNNQIEKNIIMKIYFENEIKNKDEDLVLKKKLLRKFSLPKTILNINEKYMKYKDIFKNINNPLFQIPFHLIILFIIIFSSIFYYSLDFLQKYLFINYS